MRYCLLICVLFTTTVQARLIGEDVDYSSGTTLMKGYVVYDDTFKGKRPAVLVVHEWWGHNEYARDRARQLAQLGYVAMAVDMYGNGQQAMHPDDAKKFSGALAANVGLAKQRFLAARSLLQQHKMVEAEKIAAIGYCFGGGVVLQMAREGIDLRAVVSFHGSLATNKPAEPATVKARVMVAHGGKDPFVPAADITNFLNEMNKAGVDYKFIIYSGASHAFTNPAADDYGRRFNLPLQYNRQADEDSWQDMQIFLRRVFSDS